MTRKDYVLIASALARSKPESVTLDMPSDEQHAHDCMSVADALALDNARFDRERFLKACGVQS